jgi:hypothetical protein
VAKSSKALNTRATYVVESGVPGFGRA